MGQKQGLSWTEITGLLLAKEQQEVGSKPLIPASNKPLCFVKPNQASE